MSSEEEGNQDLSALRENIEKKGKNSYYYAHGPKIDGPQWDGKEAPRLLSTVGEGDAVASRLSIVFKEYAWGDGKKLVTVYLDFAQAEQVPDEAISVGTSSDSLTFSITDFEGKDYRLYIDNLSAEVSAARVKKKEGQFKILLTKLDESPWFKLKK